MSRPTRLLAGAAVAAALALTFLSTGALSAGKGKSQAFNPQPDPPGKQAKQSKGKSSWKRIHEVDEKSKTKGGAKSLPAVQKSGKPK